MLLNNGPPKLIIRPVQLELERELFLSNFLESKQENSSDQSQTENKVQLNSVLRNREAARADEKIFLNGVQPTTAQTSRRNKTRKDFSTERWRSDLGPWLRVSATQQAEGRDREGPRDSRRRRKAERSER